MRTKLLFFSMFLFFANYSNAQNYVTIPDANFVNYLKTNFPTCINGNQLDTTCVAINDLQYLDLQGNGPIANLFGVQFFKKLSGLNCKKIELKTLPVLPASLNYLYCDSNKLVTLPALPKMLYALTCHSNELETLPILPDELNTLICSKNKLSELPILSKEMDYLMCSNNLIKKLPDLRDSLRTLHCDYNQLTDLPKLNDALIQLSCSFNQLVVLPALPPNLKSLNCENNQLTSLPAFPVVWFYLLNCAYNKISCFPPFPPYLSVKINNNPFKCLPNYVVSMDAATLKYPLCKSGDKLDNPDGCPLAVRIKGVVYKDLNNNCKKEVTDSYVRNIPLKLYDDTNKLIAHTYSDVNGEYNFWVSSAATYKVVMDTTKIPVSINCPYPGNDSVLVLSGSGADQVNFNLVCKPGFDVGVKSIAPSGKVFPGQQHVLNIYAGELTSWNGLKCSNNVSGTVKITIDGPLTYIGPAVGALTPSVSGNVFTYAISNFVAVDIWSSFKLIFSTNTNATANDSVCVTVDVMPVKGDYNVGNNTQHYCYKVFNSYDPNLKEAYPLGDIKEGFNDWFTYTIHFQNTGNAPAIDIVLRDTLDTNLEPETFQLLNYSHANQVTLKENALNFTFSNIQLVDSISDPEGSKGFIQYRIKPKTNLQAGTVIKNRAFIYFDYNTPIITNTTVNQYVKQVSVDEKGFGNILLFPNPGKGLFHLKMDDKQPLNTLTISVYNLLGKIVWNAKSSSRDMLIDLNEQPNGVYFLHINAAEFSFTQRLIKQ